MFDPKLTQKIVESFHHKRGSAIGNYNPWRAKLSNNYIVNELTCSIAVGFGDWTCKSETRMVIDGCDDVLVFLAGDNKGPFKINPNAIHGGFCHHRMELPNFAVG